MSDVLRGAIQELAKKREEQFAQVVETERAINAICRALGDEPMFPDAEGDKKPGGGAKVRKDQFYGRPLATAVQDFLEPRGHAAEPREILAAMQEGGFDFEETMGWKDKKHWLRLMSISLSKNPKFHRLKSGAFGLVKWYSTIANKKTPRAREQAVSEDEPAATNEPETR